MTEQHTHTPGPWKAETPRFGYQAVRQDPKDWDGHGYQLICTLPQSNKGTHYGEMFKANARLIAAAPDLLAVCQMILDAVEGGDEMAVVDAARAAVAKATEGVSTHKETGVTNG